MKKRIVTLCAAIVALAGCSLDSIPKEDLCPGAGIDSDDVIVYIYQNGVKEEDILHSERCPEYAPVCRAFTSDSEHSGKYFCMENCANQYCEEKDCPKGEHKVECNGRCILPGEKCKDEEEPAKCIEKCIDDHTRMVCSSDQTTYKREICASDEECREGKCIKIDEPEKPVCHADETRCVDDSTIQICNEEGKWNEPEQCQEGENCDLALNKCVASEPEPPVCEDGAIKCADDANYYVCVNGHWSTDKTSCGDGKYCDTVNQQCKGGCIDNTTRCSDDKTEIQQCDKGVWKTSYTCQNEKLCIDNECKALECTPGGTYCDSTQTPHAVYTCNEKGQKDKKIDTCNQCNDAHTGCWACTEGTFQCTEKGTLQVCEGGTWNSLSECGAGNCDSKSKTPGCNCSIGNANVESETRCNSDNSAVEICTQSTYKYTTYREWKLQTSCGGAGMCDMSSANGAACKCKENDYQCQGDTLIQCQSGILTPVKSCSASESCSAEKKDCVCKNGSRRCHNNGVEKCDNGEWKIEKSCASHQYCNNNVGSVCINKSVCTNGESKCIDGNMRKCQNGLFELEKECPGCWGDECIEESFIKENCALDSTFHWCSGVNSFGNCSFGYNPCYEYLCIVTERECSKTVKSSCNELQQSCDGTTINVCLNNELKPIVDCKDYGLDCRDGMCVSN